ncbi:MAG: hypothetical protein MRY83_11840, partial [Flavobacteriales bacterium]|nr:hypothetical protein [Flavobacteriales bacterium]
QVILVLVGYVLDIFVFLSIDSNFYRSGLIETGWEILRDFANILFIFSFLIIAFKMVLKIDDAGNKKQLMKTILVALTVNFSLFIGLAVVDASNLLAHVFYNRIEAKGEYKANSLNDADNENESSLAGFIEDFVDPNTRSVSLAIASNINPQIIITGNSGKGFLENFIIITGAGLINVLLIFVFIKMMLVFLGRTLGLMFSTMLSAIAFTSLTIPGMANKKYVGFNKWFEELVSTAFMAPVFLFFIYLAVTFLKEKGFLASLAAKPGQDFLTRMLVVFVPFLIVGGVLMLAKKISSDMVGDLGKMAVKGVGMLAGGIIAAPVAMVGGAAAIGGVAAAGGGALASGVGAAATRMGASRAGGALMRGGKTMSRVGKKAMSFKADPTKIPGFKNLVGKDVSSAIGKVTGRSALGHISKLQTAVQKGKGGVFDVETNVIGKERLEREQLEQKRKADKATDWSEKLEEARIAERLQKEESDRLKTPRSQLAQSMKERTDAKNDDSITGVHGVNYKEEKRQTELLENILNETKRTTAEGVANGLMTQAAAKSQVDSAQAAYDSYFEQTFEGKVKKREKAIEKEKNTIRNDVANDYDGKLAEKIIRGDIKSGSAKEDKDTK